MKTDINVGWWSALPVVRRLVQALAEIAEKLAYSQKENCELRRKLEAELAVKTLRTSDWVKPENRMSDAEVLAAFAVEKDHPLYLAMHQTLDDELMDLLDDATRSPLTMGSEMRTFRAGGATCSCG
jgi:hypothetical protein